MRIVPLAKLSGLPVGQWLEQNGLYDAEDGRVGAYPERKGQHSDNEKHRLAHQDTKGKANVREIAQHLGIGAAATFLNSPPGKPRWSTSSLNL